MKRPRLPYYVVRNGCAYFQLGLRRARLARMESNYRLGDDGEDARYRARELYKQYKEAVTPIAPKPQEPVRVPTFFLPRKPSLLLQFILDHKRHQGDECLVPPVKVIGASGYIHVKVTGRQVGAHRLMLLLAKEREYFNRAVAAHKCGNPSCVNPQHLYWATLRQNALDRRAHGTVRAGRRSTPGPAWQLPAPSAHENTSKRDRV